MLLEIDNSLKVSNGNGFTGHIVCSSALGCQRLIVEHFVTPVDREVQKAALRALPLINDSPLSSNEPVQCKGHVVSILQFLFFTPVR